MPNTEAPDDEALQRICEEVEAEYNVAISGGIALAATKAVARRYAAMVVVGVPEEICRRLDRELMEQNTWPPSDKLTRARSSDEFCDAWQAFRDALGPETPTETRP